MPGEGTRGKGRPPGSVNKTTASVKAALEATFERRGGIDAMVAWADDNPTDFYKLYAKLLPAELTVNMNVTDELADRLARAKAKAITNVG